jgi:molecular chaperone DnaK (HSP70)
VIDLEGIAPGDGEASIPVTDFYERTAPFVERTIEAMSSLLVRSEADSDGDPLAEVAGIYVVGGASSLPSVGRVLRERFGRRVHRSPYPSAATAVGLAIAADEGTDLVLSDHFARTFGVFRETREGQGVAFDAVFGRETRLPGAGEAPRIAERTYRAVHNIGRFRFVECASTDAEGAPLGELPFFGEIVFPFDRALQVEGYSVDHVPVARMRGPGPIVRERYTLDEHGIVQLTMTDLESGYERAFRIGS